MAADRKVRLVAVDSQKYGSRQLRPGDHFEADIYDVPDMLALGIVRTEEDIAIALAEETNDTGIILPGQPLPMPKKRRGRPPKSSYAKQGGKVDKTTRK